MKIHGKLAALLLAAATTLGACTASSESFSSDISGYSVIRGRVVQIENLHASKIEQLADGVAITISQPGCNVTIQFDDETTGEFSPPAGAILVHGFDNDYILQSQTGGPAAPLR